MVMVCLVDALACKTLPAQHCILRPWQRAGVMAVLKLELLGPLATDVNSDL